MGWSKEGRTIRVSAEFDQDDFIYIIMAMGACSGAGFKISEKVGFLLQELINKLLDECPFFTPYQIGETIPTHPEIAEFAYESLLELVNEEKVRSERPKKTKGRKAAAASRN